jgi:ketosteroid isomerase-like protein
MTSNPGTRTNAEDRLALVELVARWSHAADERDPDLLRRLLTDDAELHVADDPTTTHGADAVATRATAAPDNQQLRRHVRNTVVDELTADTASTRSYYLLTTSVDGGRPTTLATGVYTDRMRRTADGWRITERRVRHDVGANEDGPVW